MRYAALDEEVGFADPPKRASWAAAAGRATITAREAMRFRWAVLDDREPGASSHATRARRLREGCSRLCDRLRVSLSVRGSTPVGPAVIVANHISYLDPLVIGQTLPVSAVAKSEIMGWPAIGETLEELGIIFVARGNARSGAIALRKAMRVLRNGVPVLVFPEGTTTLGDTVLPFARGAFGIARLLRVPVVPATLRYESPEVPWVGTASFLPHFIKMHREHEVKAELVFGPPLPPMGFVDAASLADATRRCIESLLVR